MEIADSSLRYDGGRQTALYAGFGVRDLWVIDAVKLTIRVFREPMPDGYARQSDHSATERVTPLIAPDVFALRLADLAIE